MRRGFVRPSRRAAGIAALALALSGLDAPAAQQPPFVERVEVARVLIDARVVDARGRPVHGLQASDFAVRIGRRTVRVESAEWVGGPPENEAVVPDQTFRHGPPPGSPAVRREGAHGRLVVFLVQRDLQPLRITGLMQVGQLVDTLLQPLTSEDRVAVLSFDAHLRIWTDFTDDVGRVRSLLAERVISGQPGALVQSADVSLLARLDPARARRIHGIEHAMRHVADALEPLPGAKSLIVLGYGFGRFDARSGSVLLMDGYAEASAALQRARVAVFTLNVTRAHYNSLQAGLETVSADTGGLYASTFEFPTTAIERVTQALAGHYVLFVEPPDLGPGVHRIEVRLTSGRGHVMARRTYAAQKPGARSP